MIAPTEHPAGSSVGRRGRFRLTAVGRLTAWYAVLFTFAASSMVGGSYALVSRTFEQRLAPSSDPFAALGGDAPTPDELAQVRQILGTDPRTLLLAEARRAETGVLREMRRRSLVALLVTTTVSVLGAWWLARRAMRPVHRLTTLAQGMSAANLHDRIDLVGPDDELKALADTFDGMLGRLEQAFVAQRLFAAHVSHELRTPLTTLGAVADLIAADTGSTERERQLANAARGTVDRADRLIGSLLALSRAESGLAAREMVDVADLAGDVVADLATAADAANVTLDLSLADARVTGDRVLLRSLVENLVRNALNHNVAGGEAVIDVRTVGSEVGIRVENTGRHLSTIELAALTHPFVRIDGDHAAAPGLGIGTAVVQAVAAAHAGRFTVAGRPGGGLVAVVTLPIRAA